MLTHYVCWLCHYELFVQGFAKSGLASRGELVAYEKLHLIIKIFKFDVQTSANKNNNKIIIIDSCMSSCSYFLKHAGAGLYNICRNSNEDIEAYQHFYRLFMYYTHVTSSVYSKLKIV